MLYLSPGLPINALYVQPSVTPRQTPAPRYPSFRMVTYDRDTGDIIDIHQYYLDISMDNPTWELEYRATEAYDIADLSPVSLDQLVDKFSSEESSPDVFERYYLYNTIMASAGECDEDCKKLHICAITKLDIPEYDDCIAGSGNAVRGSLRTVILLFIVQLWQSLMSWSQATIYGGFILSLNELVESNQNDLFYKKTLEFPMNIYMPGFVQSLHSLNYSDFNLFIDTIFH